MLQRIIQAWDDTLSIEEIVRDNENKILARILTEEGQQLYLKGEKLAQIETENVCQFANDLTTILPTPTYIKTKNDTYTTQFNDFIFTLEKALTKGNEVAFVNDAQIVNVAENLAKMHIYCEKHQIQLKKATSWGMFGGNKTYALEHYDENELSFLDFKTVFLQAPLFHEINAMYQKYREQLQKLWPMLPKFATQGDFCYYNMRFKEDELVGICDFNLAGDEVYVNEYVALAVYYSWHANSVGSSSGDEKYKLFTQAYEEIRPLNLQELEAKPLLTKIIRAFRFDRIEVGIEQIDNHQDFLLQTYALLLDEE